MKTKIKWKPLIISLAISLGTGLLSALLTPHIMDSYQAMYKPPLSPPGWLFPVVWTILFFLMGIAAYLAAISGKEGSKEALKYYIVQLVFNLGWSVIFFRFHAYTLAFAWLLMLWYLVYVTAKKFYGLNEEAGKLMIPYLAWLTFAGYLNLLIAIHY